MSINRGPVGTSSGVMCPDPPRRWRYRRSPAHSIELTGLRTWPVRFPVVARDPRRTCSPRTPRYRTEAGGTAAAKLPRWPSGGDRRTSPRLSERGVRRCRDCRFQADDQAGDVTGANHAQSGFAAAQRCSQLLSRHGATLTPATVNGHDRRQPAMTVHQSSAAGGHGARPHTPAHKELCASAEVGEHGVHRAPGPSDDIRVAVSLVRQRLDGGGDGPRPAAQPPRLVHEAKSRAKYLVAGLVEPTP